ncbi:retrovirus-related Pol polyprotein from type-2 retrotransposable element R2DM [Trichonephila clavipes]|nr:retrovirus-related Pol polyprotein from type-2 retrotransposable element R2DM [Trichonephila clavipes]
MDCVIMSPASSHFLADGMYTRFADWRIIHKARLGLVPLNGIKKAVAFKGTVLSENQVVGSDGLRPDLVAVIDNTVYIIDVTVPFENRRAAYQLAKQRKIEKYTSLIPYFTGHGFNRVQIVPIIVGSLGAWDPENDILKKVATNSYLRLLRKLCVSDCIRWSRDIYIQHLTGVQQYSTDAAEIHPDPEATEENENDTNVNSSDVTSISQNVNSPNPSGQSANCPDNGSLPTIGGEPETMDIIHPETEPLSWTCDALRLQPTSVLLTSSTAAAPVPGLLLPWYAVGPISAAAPISNLFLR